MRIGEHVFYQPVTALALRIGQAVKDAIAFRVFDPVVQVALFLVAKCLAVGDEELKVARVRLIDMRVVNLIDNAVTQREPEPATGVIGRADALFGARSPAGSIPGAPNACEFSAAFGLLRVPSPPRLVEPCGRNSTEFTDRPNAPHQHWVVGQDLQILLSVVSLSDEDGRYPRVPDLLNRGKDSRHIARPQAHSEPPVTDFYVGQLALCARKSTHCPSTAS